MNTIPMNISDVMAQSIAFEMEKALNNHHIGHIALAETPHLDLTWNRLGFEIAEITIHKDGKVDRLQWQEKTAALCDLWAKQIAEHAPEVIFCNLKRYMQFEQQLSFNNGKIAFRFLRAWSYLQGDMTTVVDTMFKVNTKIAWENMKIDARVA